MRSILLLSSFLLLIAISCSKDDRADLDVNDILGIWYQEDFLQEYGRISRLEYNFKDDLSLEVLRIELNPDTRDVLGYRFRTLGNYALLNSQISFFNLTSYTNNDTQGSYTELENLDLINDSVNSQYTVTCKIEDGGNKIVFIYPPCGPAANCIGSTTLIKEVGQIK
jgi:hypothetical protein